MPVWQPDHDATPACACRPVLQREAPLDPGVWVHRIADDEPVASRQRGPRVPWPPMQEVADA